MKECAKADFEPPQPLILVLRLADAWAVLALSLCDSVVTSHHDFSSYSHSVLLCDLVAMFWPYP